MLQVKKLSKTKLFLVLCKYGFPDNFNRNSMYLVQYLLQLKSKAI